MTTRSPRPTLCAVVGDHGAGKRSLVRGLAEIFGNDRCAILALDDYVPPPPRAASAPASSLAPDLAMMAQHLRLLRQGETIFKPVVDSTTGGFDAPEFLRPAPFVLAHGRHGLGSPELRALWDVSVLVVHDASDSARREVHERERSDLALVVRQDGSIGAMQAPRYELRIARPLPLPALDALRAEPVAHAALHVAQAAGGADVIALAPDVDDVSAAFFEARLLAALPNAPTRRQLRLGWRRSAAAGTPRSPALAIVQLLIAHYVMQRARLRAELSPAAERSVHPAPGA